MAKSQDYRMGLGIRAGTDLGFSIKYFMRKSVAVEGIVATRWRGGILTGLLESHYRPFGNPDFKIYLGGGLHVGNWNGKNIHPWFPEDGISRTLAGLDGIAGIEYTFNTVPLNLGFDWKPSINFSSYKWVWLDNLGVSVRYTFK